MPNNLNEKYLINVFNSSNRKKLPIKKISQYLENVLKGESISNANINVIYVDNDEILRLNKEYLSHDYYTDVITFSLLEEDEGIDGEVYICVDVAEEQANNYNVSLSNELFRLAIHGTLHLCGYDDDNEENKSKMRDLENLYLGIK
jgi:rRNA maturation RNase YbeY